MKHLLILKGLLIWSLTIVSSSWIAGFIFYMVLYMNQLIWDPNQILGKYLLILSVLGIIGNYISFIFIVTPGIKKKKEKGKEIGYLSNEFRTGTGTTSRSRSHYK